jgi:type II secretion system protein L
LRAARFAVEDDVSVPVESLHVATGQRASAGELTDVCLVAKPVMDGWMQSLSDAGFADARIIPDMSLLPPGGVPLDLETHIAVSLQDRRFAIDKSLPEELISALLTRAGAAPERSGDPLLILAGYMLSGETGVDLRQADYARRAELPVELSRLRLLGGLAAACVLAWGIYTFASIQTMNRLEAELVRQTRATFTALYPNEPVPANILAAVRDRSGAVGPGTASFREMSGVLYAALAGSNGTNLSSLRYNAEDGELQAKLVYSAFGDDVALKAAIEAGGLAVRLGDARVEDGRVVGDLVMELPS